MGFTAHFSLSPFIHKMHKFANKKIKDQIIVFYNFLNSPAFFII